MKKNIVLFSDGTGNSAAKINKTNVWRLYKALDLSHADNNNQLAYYDDGVGSSSFKLFAMLGGAVGWGLKRNVVDLYTFLCRHYQPGDQVYCFGFSRGAFTIRVLADFILHEGLIDREQVKNESDLRYLALSAFRSYRKEKYPGGWTEWVRAIRDWTAAIAHKGFGMSWYQKDHNITVDEIAFMGLWDTVDAYGLPVEELTEAWNKVVPLALPDRNPSDRIARICHALALDDERHTFEPVLLNETNLDKDWQYPKVKRVCEERVSQVWFAGMHSNVGGGYPDDGLARVSLHWIMHEAHACGLRFRELEWQQLREARDLDGQIYDSRRGLAGFYRYQPRRLEELTDDSEHEVKVGLPKIHQSVFQRIHESPEYSPIGLPERYVVVTNEGDIVAPDTEPEHVPAGLAKGLLEKPNMAKQRGDGQDSVWRLVWWRRQVYFLTLIAGLWLASFPLWFPATGACSGSWCGLSALVRSIAAVLPGFLAPWYEAFETHPGWFLVIAVALVAMLFTGGWFQSRIRDRMQDLWKKSRMKDASTSDKQKQEKEKTWLIRFLTKHPAFIPRSGHSAVVGFAKKSLAWATVALGVVLVAVSLSRLGFGFLSSSGRICHATDPKATIMQQVKEGRLPSKDLCHATGFKTKVGKRYKVTLILEDRKDKKEGWKDASLAANVDGVISPSLGMVLALPLRRQISEPWFKPMARIGADGRDEYPLNPVDYHFEDASGQKLIAEFTARTGGELFLYVNDAILPVTSGWQRFYQNNKGQACYWVEPVGSLENNAQEGGGPRSCPTPKAEKGSD